MSLGFGLLRGGWLPWVGEHRYDAMRCLPGVLAEEEDSGVCLFLGLGEAAEGNAASLEVADALVHTRCLFGVAESRFEDIYADTVGCPLGSECAGHVGDGTLGRVVEDLGKRLVHADLVVQFGRHRRGDDDGTLLVPALDPECSDGLAAVEDTENVGLVDVVEVVCSQFQSGLDDRDTGVGEQASDLTELLLCFLGGLLDELGVADVTLVGLDLDAILLCDVGGGLLGLGVGAVEDGNVGTGVGGSLGHGETDTTVTTGDDDGAGKVDGERHCDRVLWAAIPESEQSRQTRHRLLSEMPAT